MGTKVREKGYGAGGRRKYSKFGDVIADAESEGWRVEITGRQRRFYPPEGLVLPDGRQPEVCMASPIFRDHRALKNFVAQLRRNGFIGGVKPDEIGESESGTGSESGDYQDSEETMSVFKTKRRVIEQTSGNLTPEQIQTAIIEWAQNHYGIKLPDSTRFTFVVDTAMGEIRAGFDETGDGSSPAPDGQVKQVSLVFQQEKDVPLDITLSGE